MIEREVVGGRLRWVVSDSQLPLAQPIRCRNRKQATIIWNRWQRARRNTGRTIREMTARLGKTLARMKARQKQMPQQAPRYSITLRTDLLLRRKDGD